MKRLLLIASVAMAANVGYSQVDFRKGFVVTPAHDTIHGLIKYREGAKAFVSCIFKASRKLQATTYGPNDIASYGFIDDKVFQSREVTLKDQPPAVVFLEVLVRGRVTLYRFEDVFLVEKERAGLQQLVNKSKIIDVNGSKAIRYSNEHFTVLNPLLFDCAETRPMVPEVHLTQRDLTKLIEKYNHCVGASTITFKDAKPWARAYASLMVGPSFSDVKFDYHSSYEHLSGTFYTSKSPVVGITGELLSPRISERLSFHLSVLYSSPTYKGFTLLQYVGGNYRHFVTIKLSELKVPFGFRYTFPMEAITPYVNAGISSTFHLSTSSYWIKEWEYNGIVDTAESEAVAITENQRGVWAGAGVLRSISEKLFVFGELRYERTTGIAETVIDNVAKLKSNISNFQIVLGIRF